MLVIYRSSVTPFSGRTGNSAHPIQFRAKRVFCQAFFFAYGLSGSRLFFLGVRWDKGRAHNLCHDGPVNFRHIEKVRNIVTYSAMTWYE